ncbi:MAG: ATP-binding cassette domain-containing protein [Bacilli bacterium]
MFLEINIEKKSVYLNKKELILLSNINLSFSSTGFFTIVGKSGSGKSTLLNIIGGIDTKFEGNIIFGGNKINNKNRNEYLSNHVAYVFQDFNLLKKYTVIYNCILPLLNIGIKSKDAIGKAKELLKRFGLEEKENVQCDELSGGEAQRVAIIRALIKNPDILICDEPTGNLDKRNKSEIALILSEISKEKLVLVATHEEEIFTEFLSGNVKINGGIVESCNTPLLIEEKTTSIISKKNKLFIDKDKIRYFFKHFMLQNILFVISSMIPIILMIISMLISQKNTDFVTKSLYKYKNYNYFVISEKISTTKENKGLSFTKLLKPNVDEVNDKYKDFNYHIDINLEPLISYMSIFVSNEKITNCVIEPYFDLETSNIYVNKMFVDQFKTSKLEIRCDYSQSFEVKSVMEYEELTFILNFDEVKISDEEILLSFPKIYVPFNKIINLLKEKDMSNIIENNDQIISWYDYFYSLKKDNLMSGYGLSLFSIDSKSFNHFKGVGDTGKFMFKNNALEVVNAINSQYSLINIFINIFLLSSLIGWVFIISFCVNSVLLVERRNDIIRLCLGQNKKQILKNNRTLFLILISLCTIIYFILFYVFDFIVNYLYNFTIINKFTIIISISFFIIEGILAVSAITFLNYRNFKSDYFMELRSQ